MRYLSKTSLLFAWMLLFLACPGPTTGDPIPMDRLYYPSAMLKNNDTLYVINTNLDLKYQTGSFLQINAKTGQILPSSLPIPSLAGQLETPDFVTFFTTSEDTGEFITLRSQVQKQALGQTAPYFISLIPNQPAGFLGYLVPVSSELFDPDRFSLVKSQAELQYFVGNPIQIKQNLPLANCIDPLNKQYRRMARIGGIQVVDNNLYILAEFITNPGYKQEKHVFLLRATVTNAIQGNWNDKTCIATDLSKKDGLALRAQAARGLIVTKNKATAYVLFDENPLLISISLGETPTVLKETVTCKGPSQMRLDPDENTLVVLCAKSDQVLAYNAADLSLFGEYQGGIKERKGLGPIDVQLDQGQAYVSFQSSHQIGIFTYANSSHTHRSFGPVSWLQVSR